MPNDYHLIPSRIKISIFPVFIFISTHLLSQTELNVAKEIAYAAKQYKGMLATHPNVTKFPQSILPNGQPRDMSSDWWCSGFFGGSLWYLYEFTKDTAWKNAADTWSMAVEKEQYNTTTHDLGFMLYCPLGNGYRLTNDDRYKKILLTGASSLATRFNPKYGVIKSWDRWKGYDYPVIIDNMMNLEFLFWAAKASGNKRLYDICISHADSTLKNHFRKDYSSYHVVCYGKGGKILAQKTHQGAADNSAWARGQAWAMYGYTVMYRETKQQKYLVQAEHIAKFMLNHPNLPKDKIPYWDFNVPNIPNEERDASAAAVIASGLLELSQYSKTNNKQYINAAKQMLVSLSSPKYKAVIDSNRNFLLMHSVGSKPAKSEVNTPLVYADYYYLEALLRYDRLTKNQAVIANQKAEKPSNGTLVFQTGFEGTSRVVVDVKESNVTITPHYTIDDIIGTDTTLTQKNDWVKDLDNNPYGGKFMIEYTGGDSTKRYAKIIPEPANPKNNVLQFCLKDSWEASEHQIKARIQADVYGIKKPYKEFYQSVRVFLPNDFNLLRTYPDTIKWLTISEFWNNEWWVATEKYGFRVTLGIGKQSAKEQDLTFILNAENQGQKEVWNANPSKVKVPVGKWFTMDYYYKEGNKKTGRFYMTIQEDGKPKQVVFDVTNYTHNTYDPSPNGVSGFSPMKLYTSKDIVAFMKSKGKNLEIFWDDFKLWKDKKPE